MKQKLLLTFVMALSGLIVSAYDFEVDGLCYNKLTDNTVEVTYKTVTVEWGYYYYYNSDYVSGALTIPEKINVSGKVYTVVSIGEHAFHNCCLTSVKIPESVTSIGESAFEDCESMTSVKIPDSVTSIGAWAFYDCDSLTSVEIPNSVKTIGRGTFAHCDSLTSVEIPNSVKTIGDEAFSYSGSLTSVKIPDSVTSIGSDVFRGCKGLTSVEIGNSVTSIGESAFEDCESLTSVEIGNSVTFIDSDAFYGCESLKSVKIPNSVKTIEDRAFYCCHGLRIVEIGNSVTSIGRKAFANIDILEHFYCNAINPPKCDSETFKNSYPELATLHVQKGTTNAFKSSVGWRTFTTIVEDITGVDDIVTDGEDMSAESAVEVYDMKGVKMRVATRGELESLPQGLYIVNGNKEYVK